MLIVQSSFFAIHFPPHIFHSDYLLMNLHLGWIRGVMTAFIGENECDTVIAPF